MKWLLVMLIMASISATTCGYMFGQLQEHQKKLEVREHEDLVAALTMSKQ